MNKFDITEIKRNLLRQAIDDEFTGYDPFDGLNSKIFQATPLFKWPLARLAWLQFHKRSPINFRKLLKIPKHINPKGVALFILGLIKDWQSTKNHALLEEATELGKWLLQNRCDTKTKGQSAWGYHFDWEARAFYVPVGTPNTIATCYVAMALYSLSEALCDDRFRTAAIEAGEFIDANFYIQSDGKTYYAYIPGKMVLVHNANLWASALVAKSAYHNGSDKMRTHALAAARQSVDMQATDGGWSYGTLPCHDFIDSFHTGYNIEALKIICDVLNIKEFDAAIQKGLRYYKKNFLKPNGGVKYYNNALYPADMHSIAQAIITLVSVGGSKADLLLAQKIIDWAIDLMYNPQKLCFRYQSTRFYKNNINYMRWTQAWSYYALSEFTYKYQKKMN